jgi:Fur family transcriptional regulator, ferric uptake regulator
MPTDPIPDARGVLEAAHLYCTKARIAILTILMKASEPLRQDQIAEQMEPSATNKVTIYRTLESLIEAGLVHRPFMKARAWHFELANRCTETQCHPHFTCLNCGVTRCMPGVSLPMAKSPYKGFIISHQEVRLEGLCPACA